MPFFSRPERLRPATLLITWLVVGCDPDPETVIEYEAYEGEAYPNRIAPIDYPASGAAIVTDSYSDTLSVIDLATGERIDQRPVGRNPVDIDGPHHIAIDREAGVVFTALSYPRTGLPGPHASHGGSTAPGYVQKLALADLSILGQVRVEANPGEIVLSEDGKRLVVSHFDLERATQNPTDLDAARATIAVVDPTKILPSGSLTPTFKKTCVAPHGVALSRPSADLAYVACYGEDRLAIVDLANDGATEYVDVGPGVVGFGAPSYGPYAAILSPGGAWVVLSNTVSKDVRFFDTATGAFDFDQTITTLGAPFFPTFSEDGRWIVIPTQQPDAVLMVDLDGVEPNVQRTFAAAECELPHVVERWGDGFYVVCEGDKQEPGKVVHLDAALEIVGSAEVGVYPDAIAVAKEPAR